MAEKQKQWTVSLTQKSCVMKVEVLKSCVAICFLLQMFYRPLWRRQISPSLQAGISVLNNVLIEMQDTPTPEQKASAKEIYCLVFAHSFIGCYCYYSVQLVPVKRFFSFPRGKKSCHQRLTLVSGNTGYFIHLQMN